MLRPGTQNDYINARVNLPTAKSHAEIVRDLEPRIKAQAFFSARVAEAHILERLRSVTDAYSRGEMGLGEARNMLKDFLKAEGYDPHQAGLRNLASTARLNLIIKQNSAMVHAAAEWKRMNSPEARKAFPYVRYHSKSDRKTRSAHGDLDGKIFRKDDPFLKTHTPPWEFNCRCYLEEITEKEAQRHAGMIQKTTPADKVTIDSESGFVFDPEHAFEEHNLTSLQPMSRARIIQQAEVAVKDERLGSVGMIVAPAEAVPKPVPIPGIDKVKQGFEAMKQAAVQELQSVGLDPNDLPDYKEVNRTFEQGGIQGKNITSQVKDKFPAAPFEVAKLNKRAAAVTGLGEVPITLGVGNSRNGIEHLWRNHKEMFADPELAIRVLQETLGNENCRVVVSLKRAITQVPDRGSTKKIPICLKRIVLHNPSTQSYCVMVWDGQALKLVSWNNAGDDYGNDEWSLK